MFFLIIFYLKKYSLYVKSTMYHAIVTMLRSNDNFTWQW